MAISTGTYEQVVRATAIVTGAQVVACPNVGDAAAPVMRHKGGYARQVGQAADYRHDIGRAASGGDAVVMTYYADDAWHHTTTADEAAVEALVRRWQREEQAKSRRQQSAAEAAARDARHVEAGRLIEAYAAAAFARLGIAPTRCRVEIFGDVARVHVPGYGRVVVRQSELAAQ